MIEGYLQKREQLQKIILLIDIRHEVGSNDKMMYDWIKHYHDEVIVVATKMDKIKNDTLDDLFCLEELGPEANLQLPDPILV